LFAYEFQEILASTESMQNIYFRANAIKHSKNLTKQVVSSCCLLQTKIKIELTLVIVSYLAHTVHLVDTMCILNAHYFHAISTIIANMLTMSYLHTILLHNISCLPEMVENIQSNSIYKPIVYLIFINFSLAS